MCIMMIDGNPISIVCCCSGKEQPLINNNNHRKKANDELKNNEIFFFAFFSLRSYCIDYPSIDIQCEKQFRRLDPWGHTWDSTK